VYDDDGRLLYTEPEPEFDDSDRDHLTALAQVKANECPGCGGPLDQTTDTEHVSWHVTYDECNRCETIAYTQAKASGAKDTDARKQAAPAGRLWRATAVRNP
jgi:hypothetical protein